MGFFCPSSSSSSAAASLIILTVSLHCAVLGWAGLCCAVSVCRPQLKPYFGYYDDADVIKVIPCVSFTITRARNRMRASTSHTHTHTEKERKKETEGHGREKRGEKFCILARSYEARVLAGLLSLLPFLLLLLL